MIEPVLGYIGKQRPNWRDHVNRMDRRMIPKPILQYAHRDGRSSCKTVARDRNRPRDLTCLKDGWWRWWCLVWREWQRVISAVMRTHILAYRDWTLNLHINKLNNNFSSTKHVMPIYQRSGLTEEVPVIMPNKNTVQHRTITNTQTRKH